MMPVEPARDGSLLVAGYGSGHYVYASLSFFRELPEGVPGAYNFLLTSFRQERTTSPLRLK